MDILKVQIRPVDGEPPPLKKGIFLLLQNRSQHFHLGSLIHATVNKQKLACFGHVHIMTASLKPSYRAPWRVGDTMVRRGNAGWTTLNTERVDIPALAGTACNDPLQITLKEVMSPPPIPIGQGTELN